MPVGTNGQWYDDPQEAVAADLSYTYLNAAGTTTYAFDSEDFDTLLALLNTHEFYVSSLAGADNDILFVARASGASDLTITLVDPSANNAELSVSRSGSPPWDIVVSLETGPAGAIVSTAQDVIDAIIADQDSAPYMHAELAPGNDGSGVVTALAKQNLADWTGTSPNVTVSLETSVDGSNWYAVGTAFTAKTGVGADEGRAYAGLGVSCRWKAVMTGSGGLGAVFSIDASGKK